MGKSPWTSVYDLWKEKLGYKPQRMLNNAMKRGLQLESSARWVAEEMLGREYDPIVIQHPVFDWMIASLDGYNDETRTALEIKCPNDKDHQEALEGRVPEKYIPQLQHQMAVSGIVLVYYFSYDGQNGCIVEMKRDLDYINKMIAKEEDFKRCLDQRIPPDCRETRILNMEDDEEWRRLISEYHEVKRQREELDILLESYRERAIAYAGESEAEGCGMRLTRCVRKGSYDFKKYFIDQGLDENLLLDYKLPDTEFWTLKKIKN